MNVEELKQQILKTVQYHAIEEEMARVCYELAIQFAKQEVEKAFDAGYLKGHSDGADIEKFTNHPTKEEYINDTFPNN